MRRTFLVLAAALLLAGCATRPPQGDRPPLQGNSADPIGPVGPPRTPFIERTLERARPD